MNGPPHTPQDSPQHGDKSTSNWKAWGIGCLLATLLMVSPVGMVFWQFYKGARDMKHAHDEFKRTVNPDELRAWVFSQFQKHPEGGYIEELVEEWPKTLPHFKGSRSSSVRLDSSNEKADSPRRAVLVWNFSGGYGLLVSIWLNPDGAPVDEEYTSPDQEWARGVSFSFLHK
jgi:hypothetical protein